MQPPIKVVFLLCYLTTLFLVGRLHSVVTWYLGSHQWRHVVPASLSVSELTGLLDQRGVFYGDVVEKTELVHLVNESGPVTAEEVDSLKQMAAVAAEEDPHFTTVLDYSLEVDSSRDTAWLVMVVMGDNDNNDIPGLQRKKESLMSKSSWKTLRKRARLLGVRTGVLNCSADSQGCEDRGWRTSKLQLSLPRLEYTNPRVFTYFGSPTQHKVFSWLVDKLQYNVKNITTPDQLHKEHMLLRSALHHQENLVVLFTNLKTSAPTPFFAALSANFAASAKFVWAKVRNRARLDVWCETFNVHLGHPPPKPPLILVVNSEGTSVFRQGSDECFSYSCLKNCLTFYRPGQNFGLNASFLLAIFLTIYDGFLGRGGGDGGGGITRVLFKAFIYFSSVLVLWLVLTSGETFIPVRMFNTMVLRVTRLLATTSLGAMIRNDVIIFSGNTFLLTLSLLPAACVTIALKGRLNGNNPKHENDKDDEADENKDEDSET